MFDFGQILDWTYRVMNEDFIFDNFTFNLWDVFTWSIVFTMFGWCLGKIINIWGN